MPAIRSTLATLGAVFLIGFLKPGAGHTAPAPTNRAGFEKLLMEQADPDSLATDSLGAWINIYKYILVARAVDVKLYERALLKLDTPHCNKRTLEAARLSCGLNGAAETASSLTMFPAAVEFRRDAIAYAERIAQQDPEPLLDVLLDLAFDEQLHGSLSEAEHALQRASAILAAHPRLGNLKRRFRASILRARLADARLDDATAVSVFEEAVELAIRSRAEDRTSSGERSIDGQPLDDLTRLYLRGRFCPSCGSRAAEAAKRWISAILSDHAEEQSLLSGETQDAHLLMAMSAPAEMFTPSELNNFVRQYLRVLDEATGRTFDRQIKQHLEILRFPPRGLKDREIALHFSLAQMIHPSIFDEVFARTINILRSPNPKAQSADLRDILKSEIASSFEQFGSDSAIAAHLDSLARQLQAFGFRQHARTTLHYLMNRNGAVQAKVLRKEQEKLASIYVPALARLASLDYAEGDRASALSRLNSASALARTKLRTEWAAGGAGAVLALRDLAPALRLIAQKRAEIVVPSGLSRDGAEHDALFRELQAAMFGETALAVEVANQRRILANEDFRELNRRYLGAVAEAERTAEIAGYGYDAIDVDGALKAARKAAESRRDALARTFRERLPQALTAAADIDPVSLGEAKARLRAGEALVLLHVGSHGLHGFLLDATGRSYAWRTPIRREAVEELVRSLRAGGDVAREAQPFPTADAARLYTLIFGPVQDRLNAYDKLILVGDGPLQAMPYGLLLTGAAPPPASAEAHRSAALPWLIRTHALALLPSVRTLVAQRSEAPGTRAPKPFLGIGNPILHAADVRIADASGALRSIDVPGAFQGGTGLADVSVLRRLVSLPETADELRTIAALLKAPPEALMLGTAATERAVRAAPLSDYRIVAFATHGALAGEVTGTSEPGLVLTPPHTASTDDDGFLALSEVAGLRFNADLVMLSACNTAASDGRPRAEGLSGLARGFFNAGARSLLATHWAIPSEASVKVTTGLIAHRAEQPQADWAEALRAATLAVIDREGPAEWAHPAYWGGFAVLGVMPASP